MPEPCRRSPVHLRPARRQSGCKARRIWPWQRPSVFFITYLIRFYLSPSIISAACRQISLPQDVLTIAHMKKFRADHLAIWHSNEHSRKKNLISGEMVGVSPLCKLTRKAIGNIGNRPTPSESGPRDDRKRRRLAHPGHPGVRPGHPSSTGFLPASAPPSGLREFRRRMQRLRARLRCSLW